jgi:uncharacterized DUF497 family protein
MKPFRWSAEKGEQLIRDRGVGFEQIVVAVESGGLLDVVVHPNIRQYPRQRILIVAHEGYAYLVPFVEEENYLFLKTVIPSRKATRDLLVKDESDDKT